MPKGSSCGARMLARACALWLHACVCAYVRACMGLHAACGGCMFPHRRTTHIPAQSSLGVRSSSPTVGLLPTAPHHRLRHHRHRHHHHYHPPPPADRPLLRVRRVGKAARQGVQGRGGGWWCAALGRGCGSARGRVCKASRGAPGRAKYQVQRPVADTPITRDLGCAANAQPLSQQAELNRPKCAWFGGLCAGAGAEAGCVCGQRGLHPPPPAGEAPH